MISYCGIAGYAERDTHLMDKVVPDKKSWESDEDNENGLLLASSSTSGAIIDEVLQQFPSTSTASGIFLLNYIFNHTLNHFLFFTAESCRAAGIKLAIINSSHLEIENKLKFPERIGDITIVNPGSLKRNGSYCEVILSRRSEEWIVVSVKHNHLPN